MRIFDFHAWRKDEYLGAGFWFRIFGYGLHVKDATGHRPLFSERNGLRKAYLLPWPSI